MVERKTSVFEIKDILDTLLDFVRDDIKNSPVGSTWLSRAIPNKKQLDKALELFGRDNKHMNKIITSFEFPEKLNTLPCVVVRCPGGKTGDSNIIGYDSVKSLSNSKDFDIFKNSMTYAFDYMCVGKNYEESYVISEVVKDLLVGARDSFALFGYEKIEIQTKDIYMEADFMPRMFTRVVTLGLQIGEEIPSINKNDFITKFEFITKTVE